MNVPAKFAFADAARELATAPDDYITLMAEGDAMLLLFAPRGVDDQSPHSRDEIYIVVSGHGTFRRGDEVVEFTAGDALFVAANVSHRFETFSEDFKTWVVFYGPRSGNREF